MGNPVYWKPHISETQYIGKPIYWKPKYIGIPIYWGATRRFPENPEFFNISKNICFEVSGIWKFREFSGVPANMLETQYIGNPIYWKPNIWESPYIGRPICGKPGILEPPLLETQYMGNQLYWKPNILETQYIGAPREDFP